MVPITNNCFKTVAAVVPTPRGIMAINKCATDQSREKAFENLKNKKPTICDVNSEIKSEGIAFTNVYETDSEKRSACHLVGYTDSSGHGVSGIQRAYDDFLYSEKFASAIFTTSANGDVLAGIEPKFENDLSIVKSGVVLTLDINIQNIVEETAAKMNSGCVIVAQANNAKIRAMASVPTFDISNLSDSLTRADSPMLNRALAAYSVGSVFKPCVAAVAIDSGKMHYTFNCEGSVKIFNRTFRCHNTDGHNTMNLCDAIAQSCNCYFYNIADILGGKQIIKTALSLNFGNKIKICENLYASKGEIPDEKALQNAAALANIGIGQGRLLLSPVSMLTLYLSIAGDGSYYLPSVVEKTIKNGEENIYDIGNKTRVMSADTADILKNHLKTVITNGTGIEAMPNLTTAAGKTATAQTGRYYTTGQEITNSWFCGFFPFDNPQYVMVVMSDSKLNVSTASVFAEIADKICELKGINIENND